MNSRYPVYDFSSHSADNCPAKYALLCSKLYKK